MQAPVDDTVRHEEQCGEQDQERDELGEDFRRRSDEQQCTERATDETGHAKSKQNRGTVFELFAITEQAAEESGPERDGAGPISDFRIEPEPDQDRKCQECSSSGNGIDRARCKRGAQHDKRGEETHRYRLCSKHECRMLI